MAAELSGWAATHLTAKALAEITAAASKGPAAVEAVVSTIASNAGVTIREVVRGVWLAQGSGGTMAGWAKSAASAIEVAGAASPALAEAATAATTAAGGTALGTAGTAAGALTEAAPVAAPGLFGSIASWFGGLSAAAQVAVVVGAVAAVYAGTVVVPDVLGEASGEAAIEPVPGVTQREDDERAADNESEAEAASEAAQQSFVGMAAVQVTNHPNKAVAIMSMEDIERVQNGTQNLYLCNFLHGGNCSDHCVTTPNGNEVCGQDVPATLSVISRHPGEGQTEAAWRALCGSLSEIAANRLSEGFSANYGGERVTVDWRNWMFPAAPCFFG